MKRITVPQFQLFKERSEKLVLTTAYDVTFGRLADQSGVEGILVGDSLGMVVQGHSDTLPVTIEDVLYHTRCVSRGVERAHLIADMPFLSYQASVSIAVRNAGKLLQAGAQSVKLEGGSEISETIYKLAHYGIPVMGHLGLTPQKIHQFGGFKIQARDENSQKKILKDAKVLEEAGCYSLVLEAVPSMIAQLITQSVSIPTIGVGAGPYCDGQVLVIYDILGFDKSFTPKFVKKYLNGDEALTESLRSFVLDVKEHKFPAQENCFDL